jgi:TonB-linked SusC/RagA family outer membrane protein
MRRFLSLLTVLMLSGVLAFAQNRTIVGRVTDQKGEPLPGASVKLKGSKGGVAADNDGGFRVQAKTGDIIVISGSGIETKEVTVDASNTINVSVKTTNTQMTEVVVTALNISRQPKELGYATTKIKTAELTQAKVINLQNGLTGKVSGLNIATVNNGVFADTRITLRGIRSLTGNNQPMLILDGVPVSLGFINSINPNDIADVTILKGASATAVYGPDGVNGAILVTTKRGTRGKPVITISHTTQYEKVAFLPDLQTRFGSGSSSDANGNGVYDPVENQTYGSPFDGSEVVIGRPLADGSTYKVSYEPRPDEKLKFWNTGVTNQNDISFATQDFYMSVQDVDIKGVTPKDQNRRTTFRFNASKEYNKFRASFTLGYTQGKYNVTQNSNRDFSPYWLLINTPMHIPITRFSDWRNDPWANPNGFFSDYYSNPYWVIDAYRAKGRSDDLLASMELNYKVTNWINLTYRLGGTFAFANNKNTIEAFNYSAFAKGSGKFIAGVDRPASVSDGNSFSSRLNSEVFITGKRDFGKFNVDLLLGSSVRQVESKSLGVSGSNLAIPSTFNILARKGEPGAGESNFLSRLVRGFAKLGIGYNGWAFLEATGSYDLDTRLATPGAVDYSKIGYFYPGVSASVLLSEAVPAIKNSKVVSYTKIRGSYGKTANVNLNTYALQNTFSPGAGFPYGTLPGYTADNTYRAPSYTPEFVISKEIGVELGFFRNRVNLEISAYEQDNTDQIITINSSSATGYPAASVNAASFTNRGLEFDLKLTPLIKLNNGLTIDVKGNLSINDNKVNSVFQGLDEVGIGNGNFIIKDYAAYTFKLTDYLRDDQGRVIVDATTGLPSQDPNPKIFGRTIPKYILGLSTSINFKGFTLSAVADYRSGHQVYHSIGPDLDFTGVSARSALNGRQRFVFPNSVYFDGTKYVPNTNIAIEDGGYGFWEQGAFNRNINSNYLTSAAAWKIREIALNYEVPQKFLGNGRVVKKAQVGLVGRNLFMWLPETNQWTDPEFANTTGNAQGVNNIFNTPPSRIFGFNVTLTF